MNKKIKFFHGFQKPPFELNAIDKSIIDKMNEHCNTADCYPDYECDKCLFNSTNEEAQKTFSLWIKRNHKNE